MQDKTAGFVSNRISLPKSFMYFAILKGFMIES